MAKVLVAVAIALLFIAAMSALTLGALQALGLASPAAILEAPAL